MEVSYNVDIESLSRVCQSSDDIRNDSICALQNEEHVTSFGVGKELVQGQIEDRPRDALYLQIMVLFYLAPLADSPKV